MALAKLDDVLKKAQAGHYAVGAYNFIDMEMVYGILDAAEETQTSVILQFAQVFDPIVDITRMGKTLIAAAEKASVPVVVHLDHGQDLDMVKRCADMGFTGIMIDASSKPFEENVSLSAQAVAYCKPLGIPVEAELGHVGEGKNYDLSSYAYTDPSLAKEFVERTGVDSLAVAIGTAHGVYKGIPKVDVDRLSAIREVVSIPLVLHGTSGVPDDIVRECVRRGICKVNYATDLRIAFSKGVKAYMQEDPDVFDPKKYNARGREEVKQYVMSKILVCGSDGRA